MSAIAVVVNAEVLGGAELYLTRLYREIGAEVKGTLVGRLPGWSEAGLPEVGVPVGPKWSRRHIVRSAVNAPQEARELVRATTALAPIRAHLQYKREQILLTHRLSKTVPVLWTEHGMPYGGRGSAGLAAAYRRAARSVETIVCVSTEVADAVTAIVGSAVPVRVIDNPVDQQQFSPTSDTGRRAMLRAAILPPRWLHRRVAVVASRLHPAKRLDRVIHLATTSGIPLLVVGTGADRDRLEKLAAGAEVEFLGHRNDIADILRAADVYLFSGSRSGEGQPLAVLEAAATGLHLVGFRGDVGNSLIRAAGGRIVDEYERLDPAAFPDEPSQTARDHVARHHSVEQWSREYAELLCR
ncbi:glycosyltransferase involved in cell wall biosynthesis [Nakamurella sp. UYEF19]|uniref:glycosyltransferase n=1 Tax=Nakamurella sp. UYEF19 TaxID=1756392 RepID=UPI00339AF655